MFLKIKGYNQNVYLKIIHILFLLLFALVSKDLNYVE